MVISPATSNKSLIEIGKPASAPSCCPVLRFSSAVMAIAIADSAYTRVKVAGCALIFSKLSLTKDVFSVWLNCAIPANAVEC